MPNTSEIYKALKCTQNNQTFYLSVIPSNILIDICFVSRREDNIEEGFQRTLNESRAKDIAKYLDDYNGVIPSALILSAHESANLSFNEDSNEISFIAYPKSFMVLDGQHRLFGLHKSSNTYFVPVVIFNKLILADEVNLFIDINTNQKGVPTTLILDIKRLTGRESSREDKQRMLFDKLNSDSVLKGLMSPSKSVVGKITRVSFNQATNDIFESGFFYDKDIEVIYKGLKNYLEAAEIIFRRSKSEKAKLTNTTFFKALLLIFQEVVVEALKQYNDLKVESFVNVLEPISKINFDNHTGTSNATLTKVTYEMRKELNGYERRFNIGTGQDLF